MKRVDFDPNGERNPQNRGKSAFVRISWEEATNLVASEIKRAKAVGPGAIAVDHGSHHQWGNLGHYLSAFNRFWNIVGATKLMHTPDSWEGWFWGAMHHWGNSLRLGCPEFYGTVEDCLKEAEMIVFWSSDPDTTYGFEGTQAARVGPATRHQDGPHRPSPQPHGRPRGRQVDRTEAGHRRGPSRRRSVTSGSRKASTTRSSWPSAPTVSMNGRPTSWARPTARPKTPEWQEAETGVPARDVRALAREWGSKKTYLGAGSWGVGVGGACRTATGMQWARMMTILAAMQGWGRAWRQLRQSAVRLAARLQFLFPGLRRGLVLGRAGLRRERGQQLPAHAPHRDHELGAAEHPADVAARGDRQRQGLGLPHRRRRRCRASSSRSTTRRRATCPCEMIYKYGSQRPSARWWIREPLGDDVPEPEASQFVVNQSVWKEGETTVLPTSSCPPARCSRSWDIGEWYNVGAGYVHHMFSMNNHRVISLQHKCIEPLGESKSDYDIFLAISAEARDLGAPCTRRAAPPSSTGASGCSTPPIMAKHTTWRKFLKKGYFVVPSDPEPPPGKPTAKPVVLRGPQEGHAGAVPAAVGLREGQLRRRDCRRRQASSSSSPSTLKKIRRPGPAAAQPVHAARTRTRNGHPGARGVSRCSCRLAPLPLPVPPHGR